MNSPYITYSRRPDVKPEDELNALAACYRIILDSAEQRGRLPDKNDPEDVKGRSESDFHAATRIP